MAKRGRPTKFDPKMLTQVRKLCLLGATDKAIAEFFEVSVETIDKWKVSNPEFLQAIKVGKEELDSQVVRSLYQRAVGYSHDAVKIFCDTKTGTETVVPYVEHYPPDPTSMIFWLKNRQRADWRDRQEVEHSGKVTLEDLVDASNKTDAPEK